MKTIKCKSCNHKQSSEWQYCHRCLTNIYPDESPVILTRPSWTNVHIDAGRMDSQQDTTQVEAMVTEREKEMRTSRKARLWEEGRKKEVMNYKPTWVKRGRKASELPK